MSKNMSNNIYVNSGNMMENRSTDSCDEENSYEDIYMNDDVLKSTVKKTEKGTMTSGGHNAGIRCSRLAAVCLGLLCVLLLAAITVLCVKFTAERDQLETSYNNLTIEKDQLQTRNNNLTIERDQLQTKYNNLTIERDQLQARIKTLTSERDQLQTNYITVSQQLQNNRACLEECHNWDDAMKQNWRLYKCSMYYISTESKTWDEGKQDCKNRGAALVIINSREEQEIAFTMLGGRRAWIGLNDRDTEGTWNWVDGSSAPTTGYWAKGEPNNSGDEDCGEIVNDKNLKGWNDVPCSKTNNWICEKDFTKNLVNQIRHTRFRKR